MIIYNVFPLLAGRINHWEAHFRRAAEMGFDWIFLNPVQKTGESGSLYSIGDYFQISPRLVDKDSPVAPDQQIRDACAAARRLGLGMMVDLVVNHCAADSPLTRDHPEWFAHEEDGRIEHPFCVEEDGKKVVWTDLARFDHAGTADGEGLYRYVVDIVGYLVGLGFTGFRCDAAYQIPDTFWQRLIAEVKGRHPGIVFTAETLGCTPDETKQTALAGFDYVYNSSKWWDFEAPWLLEQYELVRATTPSISFPETHDTPRLFKETQGNVDAVKQRLFFATFFSAGSMLPLGFEFGFRKPLHVVFSEPEHWEKPNIDLCAFIGQLNAVKRQYRIFQEEGPLRMLDSPDPHILLLWKTSATASEEALIILNKDTLHPHSLHAFNLVSQVKPQALLLDVTPGHADSTVDTTSMSYDLRPGHGIVLVTAEMHPR